MQENKDFFSADDPEVTVTRPRFGEEETVRARPVVPLTEGDATTHAASSGGPQVALRVPTWRARSRPLLVASVLVVAVGAVTASVLYQRSGRANAFTATQPAVRAAEEPAVMPQQTSPPQPAADASVVTAGGDKDGRGGEPRRRSPSRERRVDATYDGRADEDDEDGDSDGRRRRWRRRAGGDDERMLRRAQKVERVGQELRRIRSIFEQ